MPKMSEEGAKKKLKKLKAEVIEPELKKRLKKKVDMEMPKKPKTDADFERIHLINYRKITAMIKKFEDYLLDPKNKKDLRGVYQVVSLYAQLRETVSELRATTDLNEQVDKILDQILKPMFHDIAQMFTDRLYEMKMELRPRLGTRQKEVFDIMDANTRLLSPSIKELYNTTSDKVRNLLLEESK